MTANQPNAEERVNSIFRRLFELEAAQLNDQLRRGQVQRWDSLGHLELLAALEKEFNLQIPVDQVLDMESVGDVKNTIRRLSQNG